MKWVLLALSIVALGHHGQAEMIARCFPGWETPHGSDQCYRLPEKEAKKDFDQAREFCIGHGGDSLMIKDQNTKDWVISVMKSLDIEESVYLNAKREDNKWIWTEDNTEVDQTILPIDDQGIGDCGTFTTEGKLRAVDCTESYVFMCHRGIDLPPVCDHFSGWEQMSDHCYLVSTEQKIWNDSLDACMASAASLVTINNDTEQRFVKDAIRHKTNYVWIGMTEMGHPGTFTWADGDGSEYDQWEEGEPSSQFEGKGAGAIDKDDPDGKWKVLDGETNVVDYLCEKEQGACVYGWESFGDSCYYFNAENVDVFVWENARDTCAEVGAQLLIIDDDDENEFIGGHIDEDDRLWIGLKSIPGDNFYWVDNTVMNFTHMTDDEKEKALAADEDKCVYFHVKDPKTGETAWTPSDCHSPNHYICEVKQGEPIHLIHHPSDKYCPEGWVMKDDRCYLFPEEEKSWVDAKSYCKDNQGDLISLSSWAEQDFVHCNLQQDIFIGLTDADIEGTWVWTDGTVNDGENWSDGEPNGGTSQNCCVMYLLDGKWDDFYCDQTRNFGCEREASDQPFVDVSTTTVEPPYSENCGGLGWLENPTTGECYYVMLQEEDNYGAQSECANLDLLTDVTLLSLSTSEESAFFTEWLVAQQYSQQTFTIGMGNDYFNGNYWYDSTPVSFFNWADFEPSGSESCVELYTETGEWNDISCDKRQAFICEKKGPNYKPIEPPAPLDPQCPDGWTYFNSHCYYFYDTKVSWNTAKAWCESHLDSKLASIMDDAENNFLNGFAQEKGVDLWIGLHDDGAGANWYWDDGSDLELYKNWNDTQPDDYGGNEHCGQLRPALDGHWNDLSCDTQNSFVCKITIDICPEGWQYNNKKCYVAIEESSTNNEARAKCKEFNTNADLLTINNDDENNYFRDMLPHGPLSVWIGYTYNLSTQTWYWDDGSTMDYTNWNDNEPNNMDVEFCTEMIDAPGLTMYGKWNNLDCSGERNFGCEYFPSHYLGCEDGWILFEGSCYLFTSDFGSTFSEAKDVCAGYNAQIVSIHSIEESQFLYANMISYNGIWIGLTDEDHPGDMTWTDGTPVSFTYWDVIFDYNLAVPLCASLTYLTDRWSVDACGSWYNAVCKKAPEAKEIDTDSGCYQGDMYHEGSCYTVRNQKLSWDDALSACESNGTHLVRIEEQHEGDFFAANLGDYGSDAWTDVKVHRYEDQSVDFIFDTGKLDTFLPWDTNEPDLNSGDCIRITGTPGLAGLYRVTDCATEMNFICEYDRQGYTTPPPEPTPTHGTFCFDGWTHYNGHCYQVFTDLHKWSESETICQTYGGHLASINSEEEQNNIIQMLWYTYLPTTIDSLWVGLELDTLADKHWTDGSSIDYLDWAEDQPHLHDHENCASADKNYLKLSCTVCESHLPFICEAVEGAMVTTMAPPTTPPPTKCEDGSGDWYLFNDNCYKFISEADEDPQSWDKSVELCQADGAYLTSIENIDENYFIESMIYQMSDNGFWIGGRATEDSGFAWVDNKPFDYENWFKGEPNHYLDQEDCIEMYNLRMGKWNDKNCGHLNGRVCKRPNGATVSPSPPTIGPAGNCPENWVTVGVTGRCFIFVEEEESFDDATQACKDIYPGANLVSLHNPKELAYITAGIGLLGKDAWIGMKFEMQEYVWVDQSPVDYTPWAPGEPNGQYMGEDCVEAITPTGLMNDISSYGWNPYICAVNRDPSITKPTTFPKCDPPFENYFHYEDDCYRAETNGKSWKEAEQICAGEGAHLASANNINENAFLWILGQDERTQNPWIGLNNLKDIRAWEWSDGWPVLFSDWGEDQPQVNSSDKNCVRLNSEDGLWYNENCDEIKPFICKHSKDVAPTPDPPIVGQCPDDSWVDLKGSYCYRYFKDPMTWSDASGQCTFLESHLTSIHSEGENILIAKAIKNLHTDVWLGLIQRKSGLGWSDGTAYDYYNWHDDEPSSEDEKCTQFYAEDGTWNDAYCTNYYAFICKTPKIPYQEPTDQSFSPFDTTQGGGGGGGSGGGGLSGGAIFGIVFSVLVLFAAVGFVGFSYVKKQKKKNSYSPRRVETAAQLDLTSLDNTTDA